MEKNFGPVKLGQIFCPKFALTFKQNNYSFGQIHISYNQRKQFHIYPNFNGTTVSDI